MILVKVIGVNNLSYEIAKCIKEITRGSEMGRYLTTNEFVYSLPDDLGSSCWCCFCIDLVPTNDQNMKIQSIYS